MATSKAISWGVAAVLGAGVSGGLTYAAVATPAGAAPQTSAGQTSVPATASAAAGNGQANSAIAGLGRKALLRRLESGSLTLRTKKGDVTLDLRAGLASGVSPSSITVTSANGTPATFTVTAATKVRGKGGLTKIGSVHDGDRVLVVATKGTAVRILDAGPKPAGGANTTG